MNILQQQISKAVDMYGVSSVLEELIVKLRRDSAAGREEYPIDAEYRDELGTELVLLLTLARRIQN